ncbi:MAG: haloacid dehalogenase type II [Myxococcaceae bacterium]
MAQPRVVAFDAFETSFSMTPLRKILRRAGLRRSQTELWVSNSLRDAFAVQACAMFHPFLDVMLGAMSALMEQHGLHVTPELRAELAFALERLRPQRDFRRALKLLSAAHIPAVIVTNGSSLATESSLENAGLDDAVAHVFSVEDVRNFKPAHPAYLQIPEAMHVAPMEVLLLSAHAWDIHGAVAAGLRAAYVERGQHFSPMFEPPEYFASSLDEAVMTALRDDALLSIETLPPPLVV